VVFGYEGVGCEAGRERVAVIDDEKMTVGVVGEFEIGYGEFDEGWTGVVGYHYTCDVRFEVVKVGAEVG